MGKVRADDGPKSAFAGDGAPRQKDREASIDERALTDEQKAATPRPAGSPKRRSPSAISSTRPRFANAVPTRKSNG
jgi:hypothetical protein